MKTIQMSILWCWFGIIAISPVNLFAENYSVKSAEIARFLANIGANRLTLRDVSQYTYKDANLCFEVSFLNGMNKLQKMRFMSKVVNFAKYEELPAYDESKLAFEQYLARFNKFSKKKRPYRQLDINSLRKYISVLSQLKLLDDHPTPYKLIQRILNNPEYDFDQVFIRYSRIMEEREDQFQHAISILILPENSSVEGECSVCQEELESVSILPCEHGICEDHMRTMYLNDKEIKCPLCRKIHDTNGSSP